MKKLKTTEKQVQDVLERFPQTRNSDDLLYATVCMEIDSHAAVMPFWYVLQHRTELGLPNIKSVERSRRKIVAARPELAGNDETEGFRKLEEEKYKAYAHEI